MLCCLALVGVGLSLPAEVSGQWVLGVQGGVTTFSIGGDAPRGAGYGKQVQAMTGAVVGYRAGSSTVLRIEPGYVRKGARISYDVEGIEEPVDSLSVDLDYLSVPFVVQVFTRGGRAFVTGGLDVAFLSSATLKARSGDTVEDVKEPLESTDLSWLFGVGGLVYRGRPEISVELRYSQSLTRVLDVAPEGSGAFLPNGLRSSGFQLAAGVAWRLGGER